MTFSKLFVFGLPMVDSLAEKSTVLRYHVSYLPCRKVYCFNVTY